MPPIETKGKRQRKQANQNEEVTMATSSRVDTPFKMAPVTLRLLSGEAMTQHLTKETYGPSSKPRGGRARQPPPQAKAKAKTRLKM